MATPNVNPDAPQPEAPLTTVANGPAKCDECDAPAAFHYAWPWGESGKVCGTHAAVKQQTAANLGRELTLAALPPPSNELTPLTRSERSKLKGEVYALEAEAEDLKQRGLALYNENVRITSQLQAVTVRHDELKHQVADKTAEAEELTRRLEESDAQRGDLLDEVQRLRTLTKFQTPPQEPAADPTLVSRGLPSSSVVEGS